MTIREKILVIEDEKSISHFISTVLNTTAMKPCRPRPARRRFP